MPVPRASFNTNCARAFGLNIRSSLPLDVAEVPVDDPDVEVIFDEIANYTGEPVPQQTMCEVRSGRLLLRIDGIATYLVCDGRKIIIERATDAADDQVRLFLMGSAMGALLHQRNTLVLHGSAVVIEGQAVVFSGESGIGKSTLAMACSHAGMPLLTDDVCVVAPDDQGVLVVHPGLPESKLWRDSLSQLAIDYQGLKRVRAEIDKHALRLDGSFCATPAPLKHLYVLDADDGSSVRLTELQGPRKVAALRAQTYRPSFLEALASRTIHFRTITQLAKQARVSTVLRPRAPFLLQELVTALTRDCLA